MKSKTSPGNELFDVEFVGTEPELGAIIYSLWEKAVWGEVVWTGHEGRWCGLRNGEMAQDRKDRKDREGLARMRFT